MPKTLGRGKYPVALRSLYLLIIAEQQKFPALGELAYRSGVGTDFAPLQRYETQCVSSGIPSPERGNNKKDAIESISVMVGRVSDIIS
jgi:hypothetical protein